MKEQKESKAKKREDSMHEKQSSEKNDDVPQEVSFSQMQNRCWICGKPGYMKNKCPMADKIFQEQWAMNKAMNHNIVCQSISFTFSIEAEAIPLFLFDY